MKQLVLHDLFSTSGNCNKYVQLWLLIVCAKPVGNKWKEGAWLTASSTRCMHALSVLPQSPSAIEQDHMAINSLIWRTGKLWWRNSCGALWVGRERVFRVRFMASMLRTGGAGRACAGGHDWWPFWRSEVELCRGPDGRTSHHTADPVRDRGYSSPPRDWPTPSPHITRGKRECIKILATKFLPNLICMSYATYMKIPIIKDFGICYWNSSIF